MNLQFLYKYGKLESVELVSWSESLELSAMGALGEGVVLICNFIINFIFLIFWFFVVLVE